MSVRNDDDFIKCDDHMEIGFKAFEAFKRNAQLVLILSIAAIVEFAALSYTVGLLYIQSGQIHGDVTAEVQLAALEYAAIKRYYASESAFSWDREELASRLSHFKALSDRIQKLAMDKVEVEPKK